MGILSSRNGPCGRRMQVIHIFGVSSSAGTVHILLATLSAAVGSESFRNIIPRERWTRSSEP